MKSRNLLHGITPKPPFPGAAVVEVRGRFVGRVAPIADLALRRPARPPRHDGEPQPADPERHPASIGIDAGAFRRLHRLHALRPGDGRIDLNDHLTTVCDVLAEPISSGSLVELVVDVRPCETGFEYARMLGHIVTELVLNSVQYAHPAGAPGRIEVRCRPIGDGQLMLSVADDGVGLPEGFNAEVDGGLGLDVVRLLVRRLAAEIRFEDGGLGLTVRIVAPYDDAVARPLS